MTVILTKMVREGARKWTNLRKIQEVVLTEVGVGLNGYWIKSEEIFICDS